MAQPEYVPTAPSDKARVSERLPTPDPWWADRVGEVKPQGAQPQGRRLGTAGPDQGYALKLFGRFDDRLVLAAGEHAADVEAGTLGVALRRAALYGRSPVIHDVELALGLWGFLDAAPAELVAYRHPLFAEAAHHYGQQRAVSDQVPEETLRLSPAEVRARLADWRQLLGV